MSILDRFEDEMDVVFDATGFNLEAVKERAFYDNVTCICLDEGSEPYFDSSLGQWYPGDDPIFEVEGYTDYVNEIRDEVLAVIAKYYQCRITLELVIEATILIPDIVDVMYEYEFTECAIQAYYADEL